MKCPKCDSENRQDAQICRKCGQSLGFMTPSQGGDYSYNFWPILILGIMFTIILVISKLFYK